MEILQNFVAFSEYMNFIELPFEQLWNNRNLLLYSHIFLQFCTVIIVLVTTKKKKYLGTDSNQENWISVILLIPCKHLQWSAITSVLSSMYLAECSVFNRNTCNAPREKLGQRSHNVYLWLPGLATHMHCWVYAFILWTKTTIALPKCTLWLAIC